MKRYSAVIAALLAGPAAADSCEAAWAAITASQKLPFAVSGTMAPPDGDWCVVKDLRLDEPSFDIVESYRLGRIWQADGVRFRGEAVSWFADGAGLPLRLEMEIDGLYSYVTDGSDGRTYASAVRARASKAFVSAALAWNSEERELVVEHIKVDFVGDNALALTARVGGVDLSSPAAAQMSAMAFAVKEADLTLRSHGLFEWYLLRSFGMIELMEGDVDAYVAELKRTAIEGLEQLPQATFPDATRDAMAELIRELPNPAGVLSLSLRSDSGFGPARVMGFAFSGPPASIAEAAPIFDGVTIEVGWTHEDRP